MSDIFSAPHFSDDEAARKFLERILWPNGPVCPHCGVVGHAYETKRAGVYRCAEAICRQDFTVTTRTVMERSHIALHKWMQGFYLMASSKKGMSAHQIHRSLGITYRSAWFMWHRIREAMRAGGLSPMGGPEMPVEADETFISKKDGAEMGRGTAHKRVILSLVERGGEARSFHIDRASAAEIAPIVQANIAKEAHLMTDEAGQYVRVGKEFAAHGRVDHSREEYAYFDRKTATIISVNCAEGYFSIFKRGMIGIYQHCSEKHLHRYLADDFRYSNRVKLGVTTKSAHGA